MKRTPTAEELKSQERIKQLIAYYCEGSQQVFADRVGIGKSSVSQYVNGSNFPSNKRAAQIARAFGVSPMWVMGFDVPMFLKPEPEEKPSYYLDSETAQAAQEIFDDPDLRALFDAARDSRPENLRLAAEMLKRFKETNPDG